MLICMYICTYMCVWVCVYIYIYSLTKLCWGIAHRPQVAYRTYYWFSGHQSKYWKGSLLLNLNDLPGLVLSVWLDTWICIYIYIYIYIYIHTHVCICTFMYVLQLFLKVWIWNSVKNLSLSIYIYIYICLHTHTHTQGEIYKDFAVGWWSVSKQFSQVNLILIENFSSVTLCRYLQWFIDIFRVSTKMYIL